jgi:hypothetical protein
MMQPVYALMTLPDGFMYKVHILLLLQDLPGSLEPL